jgi:pimeloyl-ACP methyl ester carboxylesterase
MPVSGIDESQYRVARIGDADLAWIEAGPSEASSAALPLVLVHGFTGHRDDWIEVLPVLGEKRRTIAIDVRGHGDSRAIAEGSDYSFEQLVRDLVGLLDHLGVGRCDLLGHSVGGMIVLRAALAHPERVRSLIFMNTAPEVPAALRREGWEKATAIAEARGMEFLQSLSEKIGREQADPILESWGERYWLHQRRRLCAMTPESYRGIGAALFDSKSLVPRLGEIDAPSLVLVGEGDHEFLPGAELLEQHLPNWRRVTIPAAGHHPHQENKTAWLEAIENFLGDLDTIDDPE